MNSWNKFIDQRMQLPRITHHFCLQMLKNFLIGWIKLHPSWKPWQILNPSILNPKNKIQIHAGMEELLQNIIKERKKERTTLSWSLMVRPHEGQMSVLFEEVETLFSLIWRPVSLSQLVVLDHDISLLQLFGPSENRVFFFSGFPPRYPLSERFSTKKHTHNVQKRKSEEHVNQARFLSNETCFYLITHTLLQLILWCVHKDMHASTSLLFNLIFYSVISYMYTN